MADIISEFHEKYKFRNDKRQRRAISSFLKKVETSGKYPDQDRVKFFSKFRDIREQWLYGDFPMYSDKMGLKFLMSLNNDKKLQKEALLYCDLDVVSIASKKREEGKKMFEEFLSLCIESSVDERLLCKIIDIYSISDQEDITSYIKIIYNKSPRRREYKIYPHNTYDQEKTMYIVDKYNETLHELLLKVDSTSFIAEYAPAVSYNGRSEYMTPQIIKHYISASKKNGKNLSYDENLDDFINLFYFHVVQNLVYSLGLREKEYVAVFRCFNSTKSDFSYEKFFETLEEGMITEDNVVELCHYPIISDDKKICVAKKMKSNEIIKKIILTVRSTPLLIEILDEFADIIDDNFINTIIKEKNITDQKLISRLYLVIPQYRDKLIETMFYEAQKRISMCPNYKPKAMIKRKD